MLRAIRTRLSQGKQFVPNVRTAAPKNFRGLPVISDRAFADGGRACIDSCPTRAIAPDSARPGNVTIDLGRCIFCGDCADALPEGQLTFSAEYKMAAATRDALIIRHEEREQGQRSLSPVAVSTKLKDMFGRSLKLRSVSAGGCNGCELEINATTNVNFDIGRWGIDFVASPRHADGLVLSGPITKNMSEALRLCYDALPAPKFVIAVGACAISGGLYEHAPAVDRAFLERFEPQLYVPGCPPHPLTFINGVLDLLGIA